MRLTQRSVSVAVPVPLYARFDYLIPDGLDPRPGARVRVPFGRRQLTGIVLSAPGEALASEYELKPIDELIDAEPLLPPALLQLCAWAADYYQHPLGEVFATALPGALRRGETVELPRERLWQLTADGIAALAQPMRARHQRALLERLAAGALSREQLLAGQAGAAPAFKRLREQGWVEEGEAVGASTVFIVPPGPALTADQAAALASWQARPAGFGVQLLLGVTGSGKTEVYLRAIGEVLASGAQALLLVPEIGLTPQLLARVRERFGEAAAGFHSGLSDGERSRVWLRARAGELRVVVGTRSAVFLPFAQLGLVIVDEEHDASFKQQDGLRYSARDLAIVRAQQAGVPVLLGSATPSLETLHNARSGRYGELRLPQRVTSRPAPRLQLLDIRGMRLENGLAPALIAAIRRHLEDGGQVLLFLNRRGYAPALLCHDCGWVAPCARCDARLTWHRGRGRLICHHCGATQRPPKACPQCQSENLQPVGHGTERIEESLRTLFPDVRCERFDSDRLRSPRALESLLADTRDGLVRLLVGTQMLAKGHDFAGLTLVGVVDADQALHSVDFRALERMGQLLTQVSGRAGRAEKPGEVIVQTHQPEHPELQRLIRGGYEALATGLLEERRIAMLPPFAYLALLRAEAKDEAAAQRFLEDAKGLLPKGSVTAMGPVPAPMERRAGRYRAQLLLQAKSRAKLQATIAPWVRQLDALADARKVRWSVDVDPVDLY